MKRRDLLKGIVAFASMAAFPASARVVQTGSKQQAKTAVRETVKTDQQECPHSDIMYVRHKQILCLRCEKRWNTPLDYYADLMSYRAAMTMDRLYTEELTRLLAP